MFAPSVFAPSVFPPSIFPPAAEEVTIELPRVELQDATGGSTGDRFGRVLRERQRQIIEEDQFLLDTIQEFLKKL